MKMLYLMGIILVSVFLYISLFFKHKQVPFIIFSVSGVLLLFVSTLLYSFRMSGIYNSNFFLRFSFVYKFAEMSKISFREIYRMMLVGGVLIFISCTSMAFTMIQNIKKIYVVIVMLPLYVYLFLNDPETSFQLYLKSATGESVDYFLNAINAYNIALTAIYFIFPLASILIYYKKTTFIIKKRYSIFMLIYMVMYYILIFTMQSIGFIRFFQLSSVNIFKFYSPSVSNVMVSSVVMIVCIFVAAITVITIKTSKMQNYSQEIYKKNTGGIDKNLRMILHTYKNNFFAINQQINFLKTLNEPYSKDTIKIFDAIDEISNTAMNEISDRINELKNIKMACKPIDLNECIDRAVDKIFVPHNISITKQYSDGQAMVFSESSYLIEMISNLVQNSIEAISSKQNSTEDYYIILRTASESDWVLLEVEDNGCGIGDEDKEKIFEPLFSGKQGRNNFGMGLHYVRKVVAAHNGYIFVDSIQGKYTKFQIYLQKNNIDTKAKVKKK